MNPLSNLGQQLPIDLRINPSSDETQHLRKDKRRRPNGQPRREREHRTRRRAIGSADSRTAGIPNALQAAGSVLAGDPSQNFDDGPPHGGGHEWQRRHNEPEQDRHNDQTAQWPKQGDAAKDIAQSLFGRQSGPTRPAARPCDHHGARRNAPGPAHRGTASRVLSGDADDPVRPRARRRGAGHAGSRSASQARAIGIGHRSLSRWGPSDIRTL